MFSEDEERKSTKDLVDAVRVSNRRIAEVVVNKNTSTNKINDNMMIAVNGYKAAAYVDMTSKQDSSTVLGTHGLRNKVLTSSSISSPDGGIWTLKAELSKLQRRRNELLNEINNNNNNTTSNNNNNISN
jgi:hypothetical protein